MKAKMFFWLVIQTKKSVPTSGMPNRSQKSKATWLLHGESSKYMRISGYPRNLSLRVCEQSKICFLCYLQDTEYSQLA